MWLQDPRCANIVQEAWHKGLYKPDGAAITNCHATCHDQLTAWNKLEFGHVKRQIERLENSLQHLEQHPERNFEQIQEVHRSLNYWLDVENTMWHQRSRHLWTIDGDQNTSFFHQKASN